MDVSAVRIHLEVAQFGIIVLCYLTFFYQFVSPQEYYIVFKSLYKSFLNHIINKSTFDILNYLSCQLRA